MMPMEEASLPPGVMVRQVQWEDGRSCSEVRQGTKTYRVDGARVPDITVDAKTGDLLIDGRPPAYLPVGNITKVLKGPVKPGSSPCIECGHGTDLTGGAFVVGGLLGVMLGRWSAS